MLHKNDTKELTITDTIYHIDLINKATLEKQITIKSNGKLHYLALCQDSTVTINIETKENNAHSQIYIICTSKDKQKSNITINSRILHSQSSTDVTILTLAGDDADINIDGGIYIGEGVEKSAGHLTEKNIIIGKNTKINAVPILDAHSNDIQASHGASIDKLNEQDLFYLRAKGLTKEQSSNLMIQGHIDSILDHFSHDGNLNEIASIKKQIITYTNLTI